MSTAVLDSIRNSVVGICGAAAQQPMKGIHSSCDEDSGATHQQLPNSHQHNNDVHSSDSMHGDTAPATTGPGSTQPSSPESVNAGQAAQAPARPAAAAAQAPKAAAPPLTVKETATTQESDDMPPAEVQPATAAVPTASDCLVTAAEHGAEQDCALEPLPPPDDSEDPAVHAEYESYLQRWRAGATLRQRWER